MGWSAKNTGKSQIPGDLELWREVTRTVVPLKGKPAPAVDAPAWVPSPPPEPQVPQSPARKRPAPAHAPPRSGAPPLTGLDRRASRRMSRGQVDIDARIDLHGQGVEMARLRLLGFLHAARADGRRTALVITGKGTSPFARHTLHGASHFHAPERGGLLRRLVPEWFTEAEFRHLISGYQPAHPKHGGGGAFYVRLRTKR